tara:strand:- start:3216 stop:3611 length:396 start_codon:yes stop_codon:yes gene_type:complete
MINFFSKNKIIFYFSNFTLMVLYLFPGSLLGCIFLKDCKIQPQITSDYIVSSNHFYAFGLITIVSFLTFINSKNLRIILVYLIFLSVILEILHLVIPNRSFQWPDLFGNLGGVLVVILIYTIIKKYGYFKK